MSSKSPIVKQGEPYSVENSQVERKQFQFSQWGRRHGVIPEFMPFRHARNGLKFVNVIQNAIDRKLPTAKAITMADIREQVDEGLNGSCQLFPTIFRLYGSWQLPKGDATKRARYINTEYVHLDSLSDEAFLTDPEQRLEAAKKFAALGEPPQKDVARRFGITVDSVCEFFQKHDFNWVERRREGRRRLNRTWETLHDWGYTYVELGNAFGMPASTIRSRANQVPSSWEPPADPTLDWDSDTTQ